MTTLKKKIYLIGSAFGDAAADPGSKDGPEVFQKSPYLAELGLPLEWADILKPKELTKSKMQSVVEHNQELAKAVSQVLQKKGFFTVIGGDHSCAIGTWSGVYSHVGKQGDLGLIWIDAHLDSHTPETSETGNIHDSF